jgi:hypothetical protein
MVVKKARIMLKSKGLLGWLWGKAMATAVYLLNCSPTRSPDGQTLFEAWFKKKSVAHHLRTLGCIVYIKNTTLKLKKHEDRSRPMIFIGYEPVAKAYQAYDPMTKKVQVSRDVFFDEQANWDWNRGGDQGEGGGDDDTFSVEMEYSTLTHGVSVADVVVEMPVDATPQGSLVRASLSPSLAPVVMKEEAAKRRSRPHRQSFLRKMWMWRMMMRCSRLEILMTS